jgi:nucleoside-diphosphate-sugar epimerase/predicted lipid carrier protein YhbT
MDRNKTLLITGGTGLVGSLLAIRALKEGVWVRLLVRPGGEMPAAERVRRIFSFFGVAPGEWETFKDRVEIFQGDVTIPGLGLNRGEFGKLTENLAAVFHAAADTGFDGARAARSASVNIDGARNILQLVAACRARLFHISTAYIVGEVRGKVFEKEPTGTFPWRNVYEKTKFIAEREVHYFCREKGLRYCVFRPAVLIGDAVNGRTIQYNNIYHFIKIAYALSLRRKGAVAVIEADPEACLNILPVDFAVNAMWRIAQAPSVRHSIFHIANPFPPRFKDLVSMFNHILDIKAECAAPGAGANRNGASRGERIGAAFSEFNRYMFGEPEFDLSNTRSALTGYNDTFPAMDETYYRKILAHAVEQKWGKPARPPAGPAGDKTAGHFVDLYFNRFLRSKIDQRLLQNLKNLNAVVAIRVRDEKNSHWVLELKNGILTGVSKNGLVPECGYDTDISTFKAVVSGTCPPQKAFFEGRGEIFGDVEKGLQVITALGAFFTRYPYDPEHRGK